jgi:hypothetical protein
MKGDGERDQPDGGESGSHAEIPACLPNGGFSQTSQAVIKTEGF